MVVWKKDKDPPIPLALNLVVGEDGGVVQMDRHAVRLLTSEDR